MIHHHTYSEHVLGLVHLADAVLVLVQHPELAELGQIFGHRVVKGNLALFYQFGNGHTAETLGLGALHKNVVHLYAPLSSHICIAYAAGLLHAVIIKHAYGSGELAALYIRQQRVPGISGLRILYLSGLHREHGPHQKGQHNNKTSEYFHFSTD